MQALQKSKEIRELDKMIIERRQYYLEQEALISELVERGNTQLMGLNHDITLFKQQLRDIKTDIRTAAQDKVLLNEDLDSIRADIQLTVIAIHPAYS